MPAIPGFRTALLTDAAFARGGEGLAASNRVPVVLQPSGVAELDALLGGGFPRGSLVELCGPASSGRTSLSLALLAEATQREEACAFVDVSDSLDPASLAAAGVDIRRLLWIRCGGDEANDSSQRVRSTPAISLQKDVDASALRPAEAREKPTTGFLWQHPRNQMRGIETSIPSLVKQATEQVLVAQALLPVRGLQSSLGTQWHQGTTKPHSQPLAGARDKEWLYYSNSETEKNGNGAQQQHQIPVPSPEIHIVASCAGEQAEPDRQRSRRGENVRRRRFPQKQTQNRVRAALAACRKIDPHPAVGGTARHTKPWKRLEQALKATDLLLHSGGWGVVVFDLGSISWVDARRIPLSTWFRFQRIVENTPTILLLLGEEPCAKSCASLVLRCRREEEKWSSVAPANGTPDAGSPPAARLPDGQGRVGTSSPPGVAHVSHQESLEKRRHNVAQHGSAGNNGDTKTSLGRATQIASAQQSAVDPVPPPLELGLAEGPYSQGVRPGLHSVRTSGTACGEKCQLDIATFEGFEIQGKVVRSRRQSLPANSARWQTRTLCSGSF